MGASLVVREHNYCDRATLEQWVATQASEDAFEHGHCYSGMWNMCPGLSIDESKVFDSVQTATDYIEEHHRKGDPLMAVPAWHPLTLPPEEANKDAKLAELTARRKELTQLQWTQDREILQRVRAGKSLFKSCGHCESRICVKHLGDTRCPVCRQNLLRTPSDEKQLESWKTRGVALDSSIHERTQALAKKKFKTNDPTYKVWVVGGLCAS